MGALSMEDSTSAAPGAAHVPSAARPYSATSAPHIPTAARPNSAITAPAAGINVGVRSIVPNSFVADPKGLKQLALMGFSLPAATLALYKMHNQKDLAAEFLLEHSAEEIDYMLGVSPAPPAKR